MSTVLTEFMADTAAVTAYLNSVVWPDAVAQTESSTVELKLESLESLVEQDCPPRS